ncbi:hypothetical protein BRE01_43540 [Brevibacillus reuszeri]|uniref:Spore gernimation protein n=1 Tax=Brevibacillus reuszeri TaxID=54915 RepID=A0A0K9YV13_9BACL|nr:spore germination protein GerPE [Brevibacillus reuszeri]KNB72492.1 spore gernimation protein [Brevibacillus reuszeri]MED1860834.1 spore germination protein GerPE [Brevibacillus reuszeri]GED70652.1 hypothetical protein BRE01_43540 [Brevibacillus reuszeri]
MKRTSHVQCYSSISFDTSSVLQIGDSQELDTRSYVLAVQREQAIFYENEFLFQDYFVFCEPIEIPIITEPIEIQTFHENAGIYVNKVRVDFAAASSVIHIGSNDSISLETRVKNIRHVMKEKNKDQQ